jgi:hypothetical protein
MSVQKLLFGRDRTGTHTIKPSADERIAQERQAALKAALMTHLLAEGEIRDCHSERQWRVKGKLHREDDGPAIERQDGQYEWWRHGQRHRENGPAIIRPDGSWEWWLNNLLHRTNGPAERDALGQVRWWSDGRLHRVDGAAVVRQLNTTVADPSADEWWLHGFKFVDEAEWRRALLVWQAAPECDWSPTLWAQVCAAEDLVLRPIV